MQKHIIKIKTKQQNKKNLERLLRQFKDQVKHDFISWYLSRF